MSDLTEAGFKAGDTLAAIAKSFEGLSEADRKAQVKKVNGIIEFQIKSSEGKEVTWTIDLKNTGTVYKGKAKPKADVTIIVSDETFVQMAEGKLDGQKAFMTGKLKTKGNMMLATKLGPVLQAGKAKAKL